MTGYGTEQFNTPTRPSTEPSTARYPNKEWERRALEDLIASVKAHPDLADRLFAALKRNP